MNERVALGLTVAHWVSLALVVVGVAFVAVGHEVGGRAAKRRWAS